MVRIPIREIHAISKNYSLTYRRNSKAKRNLFEKFFKIIFGGEGLGQELLAREAKAAALARIEDAARTEDDFRKVVAQWNHNDKNRSRRQRRYEIGRSSEEMLHWDKTSESNEKGKMREELDVVVPRPLEHRCWRQLMRGDFIDVIYDNAYEMWQLVEEWDIAVLIKELTDKQREVLFLRVVRLCAAVQIAYCHDKTDRAIRKLLNTALDAIRDKLAPLIREQLEADFPQMTPAKRKFLAWYDR